MRVHSKKKRQILRGDIYYAELDPVKGSEQGGRCRPVVVIQNNVGNKYSPTIIVAAITSRDKKQLLPIHVEVAAAGGLAKDSHALLEQIRTIDRCRLRKYITTLDIDTMELINEALMLSVGLYPQKPVSLEVSA